MTNLGQVGRTLGLTSLTIGAAAGLVSMGALAAFRRSLPRLDGKQPLPGLREHVEVLRDRWGVPHIYAKNSADLFAAFGYVHAQDRLWQMEVQRATATGQLAEIFGAEMLDSDRFARVLGFNRLAARQLAALNDATGELLTAYVNGINAFLAAHSNRLPPEFMLVRYQPRPWQVADVLAWSNLLGFMMSTNWTVELLNARLVALLGAERAEALRLRYADDQPATVAADIFARHGIGEEVIYRAPERAEGFRPPNGGHSLPGSGSNAWVVRGQRSRSGSPLLASDPHLRAGLPAVWYEAHLQGGDYAVTGATLPGLPGVVIGHNASIAWGITNSMVDVQDLYIERFDPTDPLRYAWRGGWEEATLVCEEISVKGQAEPVVEEVRITRHGPIISPVIAAPTSPMNPDQPDQPDQSDQPDQPDQSDQPASPMNLDQPTEVLALRWVGWDQNDPISSVLALNRARNWREFRAAVAASPAPAKNYIYADVDGHYGYALGGSVPIRARGDGQLPVPGWDGEHEWVGTIPSDELPAAYDPPAGLAISANNRIASADYPHSRHLHAEWLNGYRATRIRELLDATPQHSVESFATIQRDRHSLPGLELARLLADLPVTEPLEEQARDALAAWDGEVHPDSVGAAIYVAVRYHLERLAYSALGELHHASTGRGVFRRMPGAEWLSYRALPRILARIGAATGPERADPWLAAVGEPGRTWNDVLREALALTVAELRQEFGADVQQWRYGRTHTLTLRHVLGRSTFLASIFNRGTWPIGGDIDTICVGHIWRHMSSDPVVVAPLYRQICDTGDWDASVSILISGQSGHPASRHYTDMTPLWLRGEYHPMLWSRTRIEQQTTATLHLEPAEPAERAHGNH